MTYVDVWLNFTVLFFATLSALVLGLQLVWAIRRTRRLGLTWKSVRIALRAPLSRPKTEYLCGYHLGLTFRPGQLAVLDSRKCSMCHKEKTRCC